ncbi:hypothetical protein LOK74_00285 [Brevibacillus humidisoli]|nr:sigma factor [Brevibacillus humidisoli]UFJ43432.1 hypothetical protein LOK74_00285 [Brevibacillus humidisoli]
MAVLSTFVIENKEKFYRLAYSYVKNSEDALDIIQEAIYKAIRSIDSLHHQDAIKSWR